MNVFALLDRTARRLPDHGAVFVGTRQLMSYAQLRERALRVAAGLVQRHRTGDRIALVSENRAEYFELLFGIWAAGMAAVPINCKLHAKEIEQIVGDAGAAALFASPSLRRVSRPAARSRSAATRIASCRQPRRLHRLPRSRPMRWPGCSTPAAPPAAARARC